MSGKENKAGGDPTTKDPNAKPDKTKDLLKEVDKVKDIMTTNVQNISKNLDSVEMLETKTSQMRDSSKTFSNNSRILQRKMWWKNIKLQIIIGAIVVLILAIIITIIVLKFKNN